MLNVIKLNVIMLSVVAPLFWLPTIFVTQDKFDDLNIGHDV